MATRLPGIQGLGLNNKTATYLKTVQGLGTPAARSILQPSPDMDVVRQRQAQYADYLGKTDYSAQNQEANDLAKLQFALSLMGRGFASMGAAPQPGENALGAVGRTLVAPLAGDISTIAGPLMKQRAATRLAEQQEDRQLKLAALQKVEAENTQRAELAYKLLPADTTDSGLSTLEKGVSFPVEFTNKSGKKVTAQVLYGNLNVYRTKTGEASLIRTVGNSTTTDGVVVPSGTVVPSFSKPAATTGAESPFESVKYIVRRTPGVGGKPDTFAFTGLGGAAVQVRQERGESGQLGSPLNLVGGEAVTLQPGDELAAFANLPDNLKGIVEKPTADTYKENFVVVDKATGEPVIDPQGNWTQVSLRGNKLYKLGSTKVYIQPNNTRLKALSKFDTADSGGTKETDAQRASADNLALLYNAFGSVQALPRGPNMPVTDRSAVIYRPELANAGEMPFLAVDQRFPGDRSRDMPLPKMYQKILLGKIKSAANLIKGETGTTGALARQGRVTTAANSILRITPQLLYGAADVPEVGYTNEAFLSNRVEQELTAKDAAKALREDPGANPVAVYPSVVYPTNTQQINTSPYRVKVATTHFPNAMDISVLGDPNKGIRGGYNPEVVTDRLRIERVLGEVLLRANDNEEQHRAVIQEAAAKLAAKQEALQARSAPRQEEVALRLALRQALLNFKNASVRTKIQGFVTGTLAKFASTVGWAETLAGDMAPHWRALTVASDRLSEGLSRRQGKQEFGDDRISNADAVAYKKLVADISKGANINKLLIDQHLARLEKEIGGIVKKFGGSTAFERETLEEVTRMGVDLSEASTKNEWHGHGFYGGTRFRASGQFAPTLSQDTREALRREGRLNDSMYLDKFQVPVGISYDTNPTFSKDTKVEEMGKPELDQLIRNVEQDLQIPNVEAKRRVLNGITGYYSYRDTLRN